MLEVSVQVKGVKELRRNLSNYDEIADRRLLTAMKQSVIVVESNVKPLVPVFRGRLRGSIASSVKHQGIGLITGVIGSTLSEDYPDVMEFGRRPGARGPASSKLERWTHLVLGNVKLAFVVARSIHRKGIKGLFFMLKGWRKSKGKVVGLFVKARNLIIEDLAK